MSETDEIIIITAARPGLWFKERFSPSSLGRFIHQKMNKDYAEVMKRLRDIDDSIYEWTKDIDSILKRVKARQKDPGPMTDRKAVDIYRLLSIINNRFRQIETASQILDEASQKYLDKFDSERSDQLGRDFVGLDMFDMTDKQKEELNLLRERNRFKDDRGNADDMYVTAGFFDDLKNKWLAKKLERKSLKERKEQIDNVVRMAEQMTDSLKQYLKELRNHRVSGDVSEYLDTLQLISDEQNKFQSKYREVFDKHVKGPFERLQLMEQARKQPETSAQEGDRAERPAVVEDKQRKQMLRELSGVQDTVKQAPGEPPLVDSELRQQMLRPKEPARVDTRQRQELIERYKRDEPFEVHAPGYKVPRRNVQFFDRSVEPPQDPRKGTMYVERLEDKPEEADLQKRREFLRGLEPPKRKKQKVQFFDRPPVLPEGGSGQPDPRQDTAVITQPVSDVPSTLPGEPYTSPVDEGVSFEGIDSEDLNIEEGPPTAVDRDRQVTLLSNQAFRRIKSISNPFVKVAQLTKLSHILEDIDREKSIKFLVLAEKIYQNARK